MKDEVFPLDGIFESKNLESLKCMQNVKDPETIWDSHDTSKVLHDNCICGDSESQKYP